MIYILRLSEPLGDPNGGKNSASYYLGYCKESRWRQRLKDHLTGRGACLTRAALERGINISVVMTFPGNRNDERRLKKWHNHRKVICSYAGKTGTRIFDGKIVTRIMGLGL